MRHPVGVYNKRSIFLAADTEGPRATSHDRPRLTSAWRGVPSQDIGDALAVTRAAEVTTLPISEWTGRGDYSVRSEYDPFDWLERIDSFIA